MADTEKINKRPTTLDGSRYKFDHLRYPDNVTTADSQKHYVAFYISVPEGTATKLGGENTIGIVDTTGENTTNTSNASTGILTTVGAVAGAASIFSMNKKLTSLGANASTKTRLIGAAAGAVVGGVVAATAFKKNQYMRISDAIVLGLHNIPEVHYRATWENVDLGAIGGMLAGGSSAADAGMAAAGTDLAKLAARNSLKIPGQAQSAKGYADKLGGFSDNQAKGALASITKEVANPFKEQIFNHTEFREFTFFYHFMPKNRNEAQMVKDIIEKFKFHMHPDLNDTGLFLKFPSQFDIVYYFDGKVNTNLNKIATCVLTDCFVKYGAENDKFASFRDGVPVETTLTLKFKETSVLTKKQIKDGF